jgi:hypothetical protein
VTTAGHPKPGLRPGPGLVPGPEAVPPPSSAIHDTFTRTIANGLGSTDDGFPWVIDQGNTSQFSVDGAKALIAGVAGKAPIAHVVATTLSDSFVQYRTLLTSQPSGASQQMQAALRFVDAPDYWRAGIVVSPSGGTTAQIQRQVANVNTAVGPSAGVAFTINAWYWLRFEIEGTVCRFWFWRDGTVMPATPTITGTDVDPSVSGAPASGATGFRSQTVAGNTNLGTWQIDDFTAGALTGAPTTAPPTTTAGGTTAPPTTAPPTSAIGHYEYRIDGGPWSSTSVPTATFLGLSVGTHLFDVRHWDGASYSPVASYEWAIVDTEVSIDTGPWVPSVSPMSIGPLVPGQHLFSVRGVYPDGSRSPAASYVWLIQTQATPAPVRRGVTVSPLVEWKMVLYDRTGNLLAPIERFMNGKLSIDHNGVDGLSFDIFLDDRIAPMFQELETYVKLWRTMEDYRPDPGFPDFAGVVGPIADQGSARTASIQCWSPFYNLQSRLVFALLKYGFPLKTTGAVDQGEILWNLIQYTNARHPSLIERGVVEHTVSRRMKYDKGQVIWSAIQDMTAILGGLDIWPTYVHRDGDPTLAKFNCGYVKGIYNPNARADYFTGTDNCTDMSRQSNIDIGSIGTYIEEDGQGSQISSLVPFAFAADFAQIGSGVGLWEILESQDNVSDEVLLQAIANQQLDLKRRPTITVQPTLSPVLPPWYRRNFEIGDVIPTAANRGRMRFEKPMRVFNAEMNLSVSGEETTTLTLAEDLQGVVQGVPT